MVGYPGCKVYQGCKNSLAMDILKRIPEAEHFYDLFGGGGSVTETAISFHNSGLLGNWSKWPVVHYNEIKTELYLLLKETWEGTFDIEKAKRTWISRERFFKEKDLPTAWGAMVKYCWSYACDGESYVFAKDKELFKFICFHLTLQDFFPGYNQKEKRVYLRNKFSKVAKINRAEDYQIQPLERMERMKVLKETSRLEMSNADYRDVKIATNSVVYCDIPYLDTCIDYNTNFCHSDFYEWARKSQFPVYFSSYENGGAGFDKVLERKYLTRIAKKDGKTISRTECLFWNGRKL